MLYISLFTAYHAYALKFPSAVRNSQEFKHRMQAISTALKGLDKTIAKNKNVISIHTRNGNSRKDLAKLPKRTYKKILQTKAKIAKLNKLKERVLNMQSRETLTFLRSTDKLDRKNGERKSYLRSIEDQIEYFVSGENSEYNLKLRRNQGKPHFSKNHFASGKANSLLSLSLIHISEPTRPY